MAKRAFVGLAFGLLLLGCSAQSASPEPERAAVRDVASRTELARGKLVLEQVSCAGYVQYGAALATFTLECLGTIAPESYRIAGGKLERGFDACSLDASRLRDIDAILSLQEREALAPGISQCLTRRYSAFLTDFAASEIGACPSWRKLETVNPVTPEVIEHTTRTLMNAFAHPNQSFTFPEALEEKNLWAVSFAGELEGTAAGAAAAACAGGFEGFVLGHEAQSVLTDPPTWIVPWTYPNAAADPFLNPNFYHPMSFYGPPPGAIFGHYNRFAPCPSCPAEKCSYYVGGFHVRTRLQADCLDWADISTCVSYCGPPLP